MSSLPKSWCVIEIEHVLQPLDNGNVVQQGWSPQCEKHPAAFEEWGVLKTTAIQAGYFLPEENKKIPNHLESRPAIEIKSGDILMTCAGPRNRCGVTCFVRETRPRLMMSGKMYRFRADPNKADPRYLEAFLLSQGARVAIDKMKTGISDSGLNLTHSRFLKLTLPLAPIGEQKRIVAKIEELFSELDKGIENLKTAREQLKVYRHAVLKHAYEGKLTADWRDKNEAKTQTVDQLLELINHERLARYQQKVKAYSEAMKVWDVNDKKVQRPIKPRKDTEVLPHDGDFEGLSVLPNRWKWVRLAQISYHIADGTHKTPKYLASGVPFISAKDINDFKISFDDTRFISQHEHAELIRRCCPRRGDVLITKSGTIGRVAVVKSEREFSLFESVASVPLISPNYPDFISYMSYFSIAGAFGAKNQKGVAVRHLHLEDLRRLPVPLPPISEQAEIVARLESIFSTIENEEVIISNSLAEAEILRQSILKKAFSGQLVAQDLNDESASVPRERIRAEKYTPKANGKKLKEKRQVA